MPRWHLGAILLFCRKQFQGDRSSVRDEIGCCQKWSLGICWLSCIKDTPFSTSLSLLCAIAIAQSRASKYPVNGLGISQAYCANPQRPHHFLPQRRGSGLSPAIEPRSHPTVAHTKAEYTVTQRPNVAHYCFCSLTSEPDHTHWWNNLSVVSYTSPNRNLIVNGIENTDKIFMERVAWHSLFLSPFDRNTLLSVNIELFEEACSSSLLSAVFCVLHTRSLALAGIFLTL